jgi:hypothetical protein
MSKLDDAIQAIRMGNPDEGRRLLEEMLEVDENNEQIWLWLTSVVETDEDREICLENVLALNPSNVIAQRGLEALRSGTFNVHDIMSEALEEEAEEEELEGDGVTFLDEFERAGGFEDDELVMPSTMAGQQPKKAKAKGGGLNIRLILLVAFVLIIILALGGVAVVRVLLGGGDDGDTTVSPGVEQPSTPEAPAGGGEEGQLTETPTSTPPPTATPTNTPDLSLPTRRPTDAPTPTATPVVPPTPG